MIGISQLPEIRQKKGSKKSGEEGEAMQPAKCSYHQA